MQDKVGRTMRKYVYRHMLTAKAQISLHIRAVWSGPSLSANRIWILKKVWMESKDADDALYMHRMIWICAFCLCSKVLFHLTHINKMLHQYTVPYQSDIIATRIFVWQCISWNSQIHKQIDITCRNNTHIKMYILPIEASTSTSVHWTVTFDYYSMD